MHSATPYFSPVYIMYCVNVQAKLGQKKDSDDIVPLTVIEAYFEIQACYKSTQKPNISAPKMITVLISKIMDLINP